MNRLVVESWGDRLILGFVVLSFGQCEMYRVKKFDKVEFANQRMQSNPALRVPPGGNQVDGLPPVAVGPKNT